jgi:hypothetical protein
LGGKGWATQQIWSGHGWWQGKKLKIIKNKKKKKKKKSR